MTVLKKSLMLLAAFLLLSCATSPAHEAYRRYPVPYLSAEAMIYGETKGHGACSKSLCGGAQQAAESFTQEDLRQIRILQLQISTFLWEDPVAYALAVDRDGPGSKTPRIIYTSDLDPQLCAVLLGPSRGHRHYPEPEEVARRLYGPEPESGVKHVMGTGDAAQRAWRENQTTRLAHDNWQQLIWRFTEMWDRKRTLCQMAVEGWWTGTLEPPYDATHFSARKAETE